MCRIPFQEEEAKAFAETYRNSAQAVADNNPAMPTEEDIHKTQQTQTIDLRSDTTQEVNSLYGE